MLQVVRLAAAVAFIFGSTSASAQQIPIGLDEPCMAAFNPLGYPQLNRFVPAEIPAPARNRVRGVVARSLLWQPGETIKICFRSGSNKARARVAGQASEWMQHANLRLDFGDMNAPRTCQGDNHEGIKVDFVKTGPKSGFWSAIGTTSRKADHSLNLGVLGEDELPRDQAGRMMPEAQARAIVLHEFGHALGLFHEHQSPKAGCAAEYYEEAVFAYGALRGWPPQQSLQNFRQLADTPELNATEVDRKSIMHYSLPPWLFKAGENSACAVKPNFELSDGDKAFISKVYAKSTDPQVATGPTRSATRSVKAPSVAASQAEFVDAYKRALKQAGIESHRIERLSNEFRASLAGK